MKTTARAFALLALLTLAACAPAPEDAGKQFGSGLTSKGPAIDGLDTRYGACVSEAIRRYQDTDDQDAFFEACRQATGK
jgi:hypothetical protein